MKTILLSFLFLRNFKGTNLLEIDFGGSRNIYGANESGKSTIYTAFNWLLTGKDEFDRKDYEIKNTKNRELNSRPHEVEAILKVDGRDIKLKRVYLEKWVKQKGESTRTFKGHETEYYYNDVVCSATEYQERIDAIIPANIIKLVTNPTFFNSLKWDEQRRGLISIAGEITNDEIFDSIATPEKDYGTLVMVLNSGTSIEQYKDELRAKILKLKKQAVEFMPRIDEAINNKPESEDWNVLEAQILAHENEIKLIDASLQDASQALTLSQAALMQKQKQLHAKETELANIRNRIKTDLLMKQNEGANQIASLQQQIRTCNTRIAELEKIDSDNAANKLAYEQQIENKNAIIAKLRADWDLINSEKFDFDESKCECPTCKQALPTEDIKAEHDKLLKNFNESVARRKASKVDESNQVKREISQLKERIASIDATDNSEVISNEKSKLQAFNTKLADLQLAESKKQVGDIELAVDNLVKLNGDALNLQDEINDLNKAILAESQAIGTNTGNDELKDRKSTLQALVTDLNKRLGVKLTIENTDKRIAQLETEERANAQAIADLEQQEFDVEKYTRAKMDMVQEKVNRMFKYVKFRLFDVQVNGAIVETCVCEYKGVPYPTLNTAARLLAGMDVLNTLSNFYNISAPVFCDNRESVTFIPESNSQIISLFVSPADKTLRFEAA